MNIITILTEEQKAEIHTMFFGPYKPEWRDYDGIIDNRDETIAKRLGINVSLVSSYIARIELKHFRKVMAEHERVEDVEITYVDYEFESSMNPRKHVLSRYRKINIDDNE